MRLSIQKGVGFGLTSGIITTLGLILGLYSSTNSRSVVIGGIFTIAIADALSDSLGIHISEESGTKKSAKRVWEATFATFLSKLFFALTFLVPIFLFSLDLAVIVSIFWGLFLISIFSYHIAKHQKTSPASVIREHLVITVLVIIVTYFLGSIISKMF